MAAKFIHIGNQKCGSTFIQRRIMPEIHDATPVTYDLNNVLREEIDTLILAPRPFYDRERVEGAIQDKVAELGDVCLSFEGFCGLTQGYYTGSQIEYIPERLMRAFGPTRILLVLRGQRDQLQSEYRRSVRFGLESDFETWVRSCASDQRLNFLRYAPLVEAYQETFGSEHVDVVLFRELFKKETLEAFLRSAGLSPDFLETFDFARKENESDTRPVFAMTRLVNHLFGTKQSYGINVGKARGLWAYNFWRYRCVPGLNRLTAKWGFRPPRFDFEGLDELLYDLCHEDNGQLAELIGRDDLAEHGFV